MLNKNIRPSSVLVVVAHPDDEILGVGGTIVRHINQGDLVNVIAMTNGISSRGAGLAKEIKLRNEAAKDVEKLVGFNWQMIADFPDNAMDSIPLIKVISLIEEMKKTHRPNIVYTHSAADLNIDHRIVCQATMTAFRPTPGELCEEIRLFETPSSTEYGSPDITNSFSPNLYISILNEWPIKLEALKVYGSEIRDYPHPRSLRGIEQLGRFRGTQVGVEMAEAFQVTRKIIR